MNVRVPNKLLNTILKQTSPNETEIARGKLLNALKEFQLGDVAFIGGDTALSEQCIALINEVEELERENEKLRSQNLSLLSRSGVAELQARLDAMQAELNAANAMIELQDGKQAVKKMVKASPMSDELTLQAATCLFEGMVPSQISKKFNISFVAKNIEWRAPPFPVEVQREGPLDWWQIWEMETCLTGARSGDGGSWKSRALSRFGLPKNFQYTGDLSRVPPEVVQSMRNMYFAKQSVHQ